MSYAPVLHGKSAPSDGPYDSGTSAAVPSNGVASTSALASQPTVDVGGDVSTLWIGSMPQGVKDVDLVAALSPYGDLVTAKILAKPSPQGSLSGFVRYSTRQEAYVALTSVNAGQVKVGGIPVCARWAKENSRPSVGIAALKSQAALITQGETTPQLGLTEVLQGVQPAPQLDLTIIPQVLAQTAPQLDLTTTSQVQDAQVNPQLGLPTMLQVPDAQMAPQLDLAAVLQAQHSGISALQLGMPTALVQPSLLMGTHQYAAYAQLQQLALQQQLAATQAALVTNPVISLPPSTET